MRYSLRRIQAWWSEIRAKRANEPYSIRVDDSGITLIGESVHAPLSWLQITAVFAFKVDCFSFDQIRMVLGDENLQSWMEITEDDAGYPELIKELPRRLSGCLTAEEWWQLVALPPFKTQWTQLYRKA